LLQYPIIFLDFISLFYDLVMSHRSDSVIF
jgi:hypothetical protein